MRFRAKSSDGSHGVGGRRYPFGGRRLVGGWPLGGGSLPRSGFTLIELLVVIAILALLVSILIPSLKRAQEIARAVVCMNNVRQLGLGSHMYASDFDQKLPPGGLNNRWGDQFALKLLKPYVNEDPDASVIGRTKHNTWRVLQGQSPPLDDWPSRLHCPSYMNDVRLADTWQDVSWSFCFLDGGPLQMFQENPHRSYPQDYPWADLLDFNAQACLFVDGAAWYTNLGHFRPYDEYANTHGRFCHPGGKMNMVFVDAHVESRDEEWAVDLTDDDYDLLKGK